MKQKHNVYKWKPKKSYILLHIGLFFQEKEKIVHEANITHPINQPGQVDIPTCSRTGWVVTVPSTSRIFSPLDDRLAERIDDSDWLFIFFIAL